MMFAYTALCTTPVCLPSLLCPKAGLPFILANGLFISTSSFLSLSPPLCLLSLSSIISRLSLFHSYFLPSSRPSLPIFFSHFMHLSSASPSVRTSLFYSYKAFRSVSYIKPPMHMQTCVLRFFHLVTFIYPGMLCCSFINAPPHKSHMGKLCTTNSMFLGSSCRAQACSMYFCLCCYDLAERLVTFLVSLVMFAKEGTVSSA